MKLVSLFFIATALFSQTCSQITPGWSWQNSLNLNGYQWFPNFTHYYSDKRTLPVHPNNAQYMLDIMHYPHTADRYLGAVVSGTQAITWDGYNYNNEWHVVNGNTQTRVNVFICGLASNECYPGDSDSVPVPVPRWPRVEHSCKYQQGCSYNAIGPDKQTHIIDRDNCFYYELFNTFVDDTGKLYAGNIAIFDMADGSFPTRPWEKTSASVSGLPWAPGQLRYDRYAAGQPDAGQMIYFTGLFAGHLHPSHKYTNGASHSQYPNADYVTPMPFGTILRLKSSFDTSGMGPQAKYIMETLKKYGMMLVDGGGIGDFFVTQSEGWSWADTSAIRAGVQLLNATNFEVVDTGEPEYTTTGFGGTQPPACTAPTINSFVANPSTVTYGQTTQLSWTVANGGTFNLITKVGPVRGNSVTITPVATGTYTLTAQTRCGKVSANVNVTVN